MATRATAPTAAAAAAATEPAPTHFVVMVTGQIESGRYEGLDSLYCRYTFSSGEDWQVARGVEEGITQMSTSGGSEREALSQLAVWNFPVDVTFRATGVHGWPQIVLSVYGTDAFGRSDMVRPRPTRIAQGAYLPAKDSKSFVSPSLVRAAVHTDCGIRGGSPAHGPRAARDLRAHVPSARVFALRALPVVAPRRAPRVPRLPIPLQGGWARCDPSAVIRLHEGGRGRDASGHGGAGVHGGAAGEISRAARPVALRAGEPCALVMRRGRPPAGDTRT